MTDPKTAVETLARSLHAQTESWFTFTELATAVKDQYREDARALLAEIAPQIRAEAMEEAARVADAWAEENGRMAQDTIALDPMLHRQRGEMLTTEEWEKASELADEGARLSAMAEAARLIAAAIRERARG